MEEPKISETEKLAGTINKSLGCLLWGLWMLVCWIVFIFIFGWDLAGFFMGIVLVITAVVAITYLIKGSKK